MTIRTFSSHTMPKPALMGRTGFAAYWLAFTFVAAAWLVLLQQQHVLWQRLPASTVERFVADHIVAPLPELPGLMALQPACARQPGGLARWSRSQLSAELAQCLADPAGEVSGTAAQAAVQHYQAMLEQQAQAADVWLAEYSRVAPQVRAQIQAELTQLQTQPAGALSAVQQSMYSWFPPAPLTPREATHPTFADQAANELRAQTLASRAKVAALAQSSQTLGERARTLALMATGKQLVTDYGVAPPAVHLNTARNTLAEALERQRRARGYQERGFTFTHLHALPGILCVSSLLLLLVVAVTARSKGWVLAVWGMACVLLAVGALMLTDVALTGEPALRYLAVRQFQSLGVGNWWLPLTVSVPLPQALGLGGLTLWWPMLLTALSLLLLRAISTGQGRVLAPLRLWIRGGSQLGWGVAQSGVLLVSGMAVVLLLGMPAAVSELLILLGCVGVASYLASQAAHANAGAELELYSITLVASALVLAVGGALARGDLGHALLALLLAACFAWLFAWVWLRAFVLLALVAVVGAVAMCWVAGELVGPLEWLQKHLPAHAQDRMLAMVNPFQAGSSDLARVRWLMQSADMSGWGMGYAPWQGLAGARAQDSLPLQGPSDYVLALTTTLWGQAGGLLLLASVLVVFVLAAIVGLRTALRAAMPQAVRWLAALGGFGCMVMAAKVVLSVGGVVGVLPLTGLPVALLGYGPVTHLAALFYLALALGTLHVQAPNPQRGINVQSPRIASGAVRRRGLAMALAGTAGLAVFLGVGFWHLRAEQQINQNSHTSQTRLELAQDLTLAIVHKNALADAASAVPAKAAPACAELDNAVAAWNLRLDALTQKVRMPGKATTSPTRASDLFLDAPRLLAVRPVHTHRACKGLARTLGQMLDSDFARIIGRSSSLAQEGNALLPQAIAAQMSVFDKPRTLGPRTVDYTTGNAWWGRPGCVLPAEYALSCAQTAGKPAKGWTAQNLNAEVLTDVWLQRELAPQLFAAQRTVAGSDTFNHHPVAVGPAIGLTLVPALQQKAQRMVDCATARLKGSDCQDVLPQDPAWRERHYVGDDALRAGAMGIVMAEVDSGRVVAMAGAVSDCSMRHLGQLAQADALGQMPALRDGFRCAQLPDQRSAWLAQQHPALWMLPPGSSLKPFSVVAGLDAKLIAPGQAQDDYWKGILAESDKRLPIQRIALAAGQRFLDVLSGLGFGQATPDLLWGRPSAQEDTSRKLPAWNVPSYAGSQNLRATSMPLEQAEQIRDKKQAGINVDKLYGEAVTKEFVAARKLADAALGGGDVRINAIGLLDAWRALDQRARGKSTITTLHLLEQPGLATEHKPLEWLSTQAATRVLGMTTGVTSSHWKGTAQGSCRVVLGACPAQGLGNFSGKTGSSDFLTHEDGPYAKPDMQMPSKFFAGVFAAPDGKRYAIAVMALRVREGNSRTLDLKSSAAAEAALTMMRGMGVQ